jgi:chromosome segregation ATPase
MDDNKESFQGFYIRKNVLLIFSILVIIAMLMTISKFQDLKKQNAELSTRLSNIEIQILKLKKQENIVDDYINNLRISCDNLISNVDSFRDGYTDWKDIVNEVEVFTYEIDNNIYELENEVETLHNMLKKIK